ncbi:MAG: DUF21 domain-containing protein [Gammaproteobacteria bacterium AqS3]|nr:DUF21 domain-containing protein [Gammaproteobacteria bacterium AqS3]
MNAITPTEALSIAAGLLVLSAVFSSSETAMMSLNRYRVRHRAQSGGRTARWVYELISRPDKLISVILIGNNLVNLLATALVTLAVVEIWGKDAVTWATLALTLVVLIFAEVLPKTLAAQNPDFIAQPMSLPLKVLLWVLTPVVWGIGLISNAVLRLFPAGDKRANELLSLDELRTLVRDTGDLIPEQHQSMLLNIINLEHLAVHDVMVPRNKIVGIDLAQDIEKVTKVLVEQPFYEFPVYRENLNELHGVLSSRDIGRLMSLPEITKDAVREACTAPYYVPDTVPLHQQLAEFREKGHSLALVVDEHGDVQGLVTREDILEEIVGEFDVDKKPDGRIAPQRDGSCFADGDASVREVNRLMDWELPTRRAVTMSGLLTDHLEVLPGGNLCTVIEGYRIETMSVSEKAILRMRIWPDPEADRQ